MKIRTKIDPYIYPLIIIGAFVVGFIIAIALGFSPEHSSGKREPRSENVPSLVQTVPTNIFLEL